MQGLLNKKINFKEEQEESKYQGTTTSSFVGKSITPSISPLWFACDHSKPILSIDCSDKLDLVATASLDGTIAIRIFSTGKLWQLLHPSLTHHGSDYILAMVRISPAGYIVAVLRCKKTTPRLPDALVVYSMNGELIFERDARDIIHTMVIDTFGYNIITGGSGGRLICYETV